MKTIGIILRPFKENNKDFIGTRKDLFEVFKNYNINILGIPINIKFKKIIDLVNLCNGIVLSGGDEHIENDYKLVKFLYEKNIPTLGICLGMQAMAKTFNGGQEIRIKNHNYKTGYVHSIIISRDSKLYTIIKKDKIYVNSRHQHAVLPSKLNTCAKSEDGIIEAVEDKYKKFFIGVEWHPESIMDENSKNLFQSFIDNL